MSGSSVEEIKKHNKIYWGIFFALLLLTAVTVGVSYFHMPIHYAVLLAVVVASIKGSLVAGYFMHLIGEKPIIFWVLALTVAFFAFVLVIPVVTDREASGTRQMWSPGPTTAQESSGEHHP